VVGRRGQGTGRQEEKPGASGRHSVQM